MVEIFLLESEKSELCEYLEKYHTDDSIEWLLVNEIEIFVQINISILQRNLFI
jgi:hypothetical protein